MRRSQRGERLSRWLSSAGFSPWFPVAPRLRPCHYRLLIFAITPCLLVSFPSAVVRCLCNTAYEAWWSAPLSPWEKSICPIGSCLALSDSSIIFLSSLSVVWSRSFLPVWVNSGSPFLVTNYYSHHGAHKPKHSMAPVWGLFSMKRSAQRHNIMKLLDGAFGFKPLKLLCNRGRVSILRNV